MDFARRHELGIVRQPYARNSSSAVYLINGVNTTRNLTHIAEELLDRMDVEAVPARVETVLTLDDLDRTFRQPNPPRKRRYALPRLDYSETMERIHKKYE